MQRGVFDIKKNENFLIGNLYSVMEQDKEVNEDTEFYP
nr:hypothetical protein [Mucilaginibacter sp. FT3.2]